MNKCEQGRERERVVLTGKLEIIMLQKRLTFGTKFKFLRSIKTFKQLLLEIEISGLVSPFHSIHCAV